MEPFLKDGGRLPPWRLDNLPAPRPFTLRNVLATVGPGAIALSMSISGGEWLLGPASVVKYGFSLMWVVTLSVLLQLGLNVMFIRYTLYTGEPVVNGFLRTKPGPLFWAVVYIVLALLHVGWPLGAAGLASSVFGALFGRLPGDSDGTALLLIGYASFFLSVLVVAFGGKVERMLEWVNWFMVIFIIGFLLVVDILFVPAHLWWEALVGHFQFGSIPRGADWKLLGAFAAFAGMGGMANAWTTNWIRDKGFGMGAVVGYIPSMLGGKSVKVSPTGAVFPMTARNLSRWREWWKYVWVDQGIVWAVGCFLGMYLNVILAKSLIPSDTNMIDLGAGAYQAKYLAARGGQLLWFLTLLNGFWIFFGTQLGVVDGFVRLSTDIVWSASRKVRDFAKGDIRRVYYALLVLFVLWGCFAINLAPPAALFIISGNAAGLILVVTGIHALVLNRTFLPREVRGPSWQVWIVVAAVLFYGFFLVMSLAQRFGLA